MYGFAALYSFNEHSQAGMAELVDARDSKSRAYCLQSWGQYYL